MSASSLNPLIVRTSLPGEKRLIRVYFRNLANAQRDESLNPLLPRIPLIIEDIKAADIDGKIDVAIFNEAGRPSGGKSWTHMAGIIEEATGLVYLGLKRLNGSKNPFGKALFINTSTVAEYSFMRMGTGGDFNMWNGDGYGNDIARMTVCPVVTESAVINDKETMVTRIIQDKQLDIACVLFPPFPQPHSSRMKVAEWVNDRYNLADLWVGDWNTYVDDGGDDVVSEVVKDGKLVECDLGVPFTFKAFPHDTVPKPAGFASLLNADSEIVSECDGVINVRFASVLDRVFHRPRVVCTAKAMPFTDASDHTGVVVDVVI